MILVISGILVTQTSAVQQVSVNIQNNYPVDIVLCMGESNFITDGFKENLTEALVAAGVARTRINIQATETQEFTSTGSGLQTMLETWTKFPTNASTPYIVHGRLMGPNIGGNIAAGMLYNAIPETNQKVAATLTFPGYCDGHPAGVSTRVSKNANGTYNMFYATLDCDQLVTDPYVRLYYITNYPLLTGAPYAYMTMKNTPNAQLVAQGARYPLMKSLVWDAAVSLTKCDPFTLSMESKGNTHRVWVNGTLHIEYTSNNIPVGVPAYMVLYPLHSGIGSCVFSIDNLVPLVDAVRAPSYTPGSGKFIIDICDTPRKDFEQSALVGELTQRLLEDTVYYIGWGTSQSEASMRQFIQHNENNGAYMNTAFSDIYQRTAAYIEPIVNSKFTGNDTYLLQGKAYSFATTGH